MSGAANLDQIDISIVIPAFNEQYRLPKTLISLKEYLDSRSEKIEVIVVDDGSSDNTAEVAKDFAQKFSDYLILHLAKNIGKGGAVKAGMLKAKGNWVLFADADGSTPFAELIRLEAAIRNGADVAIGSRAKHSTDTYVKTRWYRKFLGQAFNRIVNLIAVPGIRDTQCGFKLFNRRAVNIIFAKQTACGFSFDVELLMLARKSGLEIAEIPVNWTNVDGSKVNLVLDSSKMFLDIFRFLWRHRSVCPPLDEKTSK